MPKRQPKKGYQSLRSGLVIYPAQQTQIDTTIEELLRGLPAHFILLADVTGQVLSVRGKQANIDPVALGSLVAGDLAASQEIARLTGEYQDYQMVLREGQSMHTFILEAGHYLALLVQVANQVPLGWARMITLKAARQLADIVAEAPSEAEEKAQAEQLDPVLNQEELPDLFGDALDDLWLE